MSARGSFGEPLISRERFAALNIQQACPACRTLGGHAPTCVIRLADAVEHMAEPTGKEQR